MKMKNFPVTFKLLFGLLGFSAIITEIATLVERGTFRAENFFTYFTIESNILAVIILITGAFMLVAGAQSKLFDLVRGAATLYMIVTGIVFAVLLAGIEGSTLTAVPWDNIVLHYIIPSVMLLDWVLYPPDARIRFRQSLVWLIYPLVYVSYSLIRGAIIGWYPYPFLDPSTNGVSGLIIVCLGITLLVVVLALGLARIRIVRHKNG